MNTTLSSPSNVSTSRLLPGRRSFHELPAWNFYEVLLAGALVFFFLVSKPFAAGQDPSATRVIPETAQRGDPILVIIHVEPGAATEGWRVTEQVPAGFAVRDISHDGELVSGPRRVEWGRFTSSNERELSFRLVPTQFGLEANVVQLGGPESGLFADPVETPFPIEGPDTIIITERVRLREPIAERFLPESVRLGEPVTVVIRAAPGTDGPWTLTEQVPEGFTVSEISHEGVFVPGTRQIHWGSFPDTEEREVSFTLVPAQLALGTALVPLGGPDAGLRDDPIITPAPIDGPAFIAIEGTPFPRVPVAPSDPDLPAPIIITQPESQEVRRGNDATFEIAATGTAPLAYQWFLNGKAIPGASASKRIVRDATRADQGVYFVVVADRDGNATVSRPAFLRVRYPDDPPAGPAITGHPIDQRIRLGGTARFTVETNGSVQWYRNGIPIEGATSRTLVITDAEEFDAGVYYARVTGQGVATFSRGAVLIVEIPAPFTVVRAEQQHLRKVFNLAGSYTARVEGDGVTIDLQYSLAHNQHGRLTGNGSVSANTSAGSFSSGNLEVHGYVRRIGHPAQPIYRVNLTLRANEGSNGMTLHKILEVDEPNDRLVGQARGRIVVGGSSQSFVVNGHQISLPPDRDGSWSLSLVPPVYDMEGEATLRVQGDELHYHVTRHHLPVQQVDVFHLRGVGDESRGSNIRVDTDIGNNVIRMFGQVKGQDLDTPLDP